MYKLNVSESLNYLNSWIKKLVMINFFLLLMTLCFRLAMWYMSHETMQSADAGYDVLEAFKIGLLFDESAIVQALLLPLLYLMFVTLKRKEALLENYGRHIRPYVMFIFFLFALILFFDLHYFRVFRVHLDARFLDLSDPAVLKFYEDMAEPVFLISMLVGAAIYFWLVTKITGKILKPLRLKQSFVQRNALLYIPVFLFYAILVTVAIRGSFTTEAIGLHTTRVSDDPFINRLAYSGIQSFVATLEGETLKALNIDFNLGERL